MHYLDVISKIVEEYYNVLQQNRFLGKNDMLLEIIKTINVAFRKDDVIVLENLDIINQFIKQITEKYNDLNDETTYKNVLNSIKAFITCNNKHEIFGELNDDKNIINLLLEEPTISAEVFNEIIEFLTIFANSVTEELETKVLKAINKMMQEGIETKNIMPEQLNSTVIEICNVMNSYNKKKISEEYLHEFFISILEDYEMHKENKCTLEQFFENLKANANIIIENTITTNKEQDASQQEDKKFDEKREMPKGLNNLPQMINGLPFNFLETLNSIKGKRTFGRMAAFGAAALLIVGVSSKVYSHFKEPVPIETQVSGKGNQAEDEEEVFQDETESAEDTYYTGEYQDDYETNEQNVANTQKPENYYDLPVHIYTATNTNLGAHGAKEGTEVVAMSDAYGDIYKISYIENGELKEITNPAQIDTFKDYLLTDIEGYISEYEQAPYDITNIVEPQVYKLNQDYDFRFKQDSEPKENDTDLPDGEIDAPEDSYNIEDIDETEFEDEDEDEVIEVSLKKGDVIFGYPIVTMDEKYGPQVVIRYENSKEVKIDIPLMYFEESVSTFDYTSVIKRELYGKDLIYTAKEATPVFDEIHDKYVGIIEEGAEVQIDFTDEEHAVVLCNGNMVGYWNEPEVQEKIEEYSYNIDQPEQIEAIVDEHYPVSQVNDQYYNGIVIPESADLSNVFISDQNESKMPNTKFNEIQGNIIEIDPNQNVNSILERIEQVLRINGKPFGIKCKIENEEELKKVSNTITKINGKYRDYLQYGVLFETNIDCDRWIPGWGQSVKNDDYTSKTELIKTIYRTLKEMGMPTSLIKTVDDNISEEEFATDQIEFTLVSPRNDDNEYTEEIEKYYQQLINAGYRVTNRVDKNRIAIDDALVNSAMKNIAKSITIHPNINYEDTEVYFDGMKNEEVNNDEITGEDEEQAVLENEYIQTGDYEEGYELE